MQSMQFAPGEAPSQLLKKQKRDATFQVGYIHNQRSIKTIFIFWWL